MCGVSEIPPVGDDRLPCERANAVRLEMPTFDPHAWTVVGVPAMPYLGERLSLRYITAPSGG
jgi:hypothetical protein